MRIDGAVALVTGASGGLGQAFLHVLLERGARRVYAAARDPAKLGGLNDTRISSLKLDLNDLKQIEAAGSSAQDVTLLINNAGYLAGGGALSPDAVDHARREFETNVLGPLALTRAFAPVLKANGGGAVLNIASIGAFVTMPAVGTYSASKAALLAISRSLRAELRAGGTRVVVAMPSSLDTPMNRSGRPGADPREVAAACLDAVERGPDEVYPDAQSQALHERHRRDPDELQDWAGQFLPKT